MLWFGGALDWRPKWLPGVLLELGSKYNSYNCEACTIIFSVKTHKRKIICWDLNSGIE